jgi:2-hydroxy-3-keto-5-methylthiopentenyl-1-phosphate phosphatase
MLILCDFDGTITMQDVTNLIWDRYIGPSWRDDLLTSYKRGHISHLKIMVDGYKRIHATKQELLDYVRPLISLRPHFEDLRQHCLSKNWPLTVLSGGLDFYIEAFLPPGVPFYSYSAKYDHRWEVFAPPDIEKNDADDFKVCVKQLLKKKHRKEKVVFIGDGRNDFPVAQRSDVVFAVRGSTLAHLCKECGQLCHEFDDFSEVVQKLSTGS